MKKIIVIITFLLLFTTIAEAATLTTTIVRVREYLYETDSTNSIYSDALITEAINEGQNTLSNLLSLSSNWENKTNADCVYTTGAVSVSAPTGLSRVLAVWDSTTNKPYIQVKPENSFQLFSATAKDPMFDISNGVINFRPAAAAPGTLEISYLKAYPELTSGSDTLSVQTRYTRMLIYASTWIILKNDNQTARAENVYKLLTDLVTIENTAKNNTNITERAQQGAK